MHIKIFFRLLVDMAMLLFTTALMAYTLAENELHELLGILFFALYFLHQVLNIRWFRGLLTGKYTLRRIVNTIVDVLLSVALPAHLEPINILVVGYSDEKPEAPDRHAGNRKPDMAFIFSDVLDNNPSIKLFKINSNAAYFTFGSDTHIRTKYTHT